MKKLLIAALLLFPFSLLAATAQLTCTAPTLNTDGSAITGAITYNFYRGTTSTPTTKLNTTPTTVCAYTDNTAPFGTSYYAATAIVVGVESAKSAVFSKVITQTVPTPPIITTIEVVSGIPFTPVYRVVNGNQRSDSVVGFVPTGTACTGGVIFQYRGKNYRKVPQTAVKWWTQPTSQIAAACA